MVGMLALHRQDTAHMQQQDLELLHQLLAEMLRWLFNGLTISWWKWTPKCPLCSLPWSALITKCLQRRPKYMPTVDCCNGQAQLNEPALRCIIILQLVYPHSLYLMSQSLSVQLAGNEQFISQETKEKGCKSI